MIASKSSLAVALSKLRDTGERQIRLEQYTTPSELAAVFLWNAFMQGDIAGKCVVDAGCGNGILGIGALMLGAKRVYFVDMDNGALETAKANYMSVKSEYNLPGKGLFRHADIGSFTEKADTVIQNPPFGTKSRHADRLFLVCAFKLANSVYSVHKATSRRFIESIASDHGFYVRSASEEAFPINASYKFHSKKVRDVAVGIWHLAAKKTQTTAIFK